MIDLSPVWNPHVLKVIDTNVEGSKIEHIAYRRNYPKTTEELYTEAVKELVYRSATDEVKEVYFSENASKTYLDGIVEVVKNEIAIIATILKEDKANNYFELEVDHNDDTQPKELSDDEKLLRSYIDQISIKIDYDKRFGYGPWYASICVTYSKINKDHTDEVSPIWCDCEAPLCDIYDGARNKLLYKKGENVYTVYATPNCIFDECDAENYKQEFYKLYKENLEKVVKQFSPKFINAAIAAKNNKDCSTCNRAKNFGDKCFDHECDPEDISEAKEDIKLVETDRCNVTATINNEKIINCLKARVKKESLLMVEHSLAVMDYMATFESNEEYDPDHGDENYVPADPDNEVDSVSS